MSGYFLRIARQAGATRLAVSFYDWESATAWSLRGGEWFHAASTIKLAILFGLVYGYLALAHAELLFGSAFLLAVGFAMLAGFAVLGRLYWFSAPFWSVCVALACYAGAILAARG